LGGIIWNNWSFFFLFAVIAVGCLYEYQKLLALIYPSYKQISLVHKWGLIALALGIMFSLANKILPIDAAVFILVRTKVVPVIAGIVFLSDIIITRKLSLQNLAISFAGLIYIPMSLSLFYIIKGANANYNYDQFYAAFKYVIPLLIVLSIWVNDTMAYLVGSFIGKRQLSPVSPNKTWEGTIAGIIITVLLVPTTTAYIFRDLDTNFVFLLCLISTIAGTYGDLFESSLKRQAGVKDSGKMMPGHGGFLDRFDSILLAVPFVWFLMDILYRR
jgi:phosphatidate cytidylyltransferase